MKGEARVGVFTCGVSPALYVLPHPPLGLPVILLIRRVLCRALEKLREQNFNFSAATEDQVTAALRSVIENDLRQTGEVAGFNRHYYEAVVRQGQVANFDGTRLNKAPDLSFKLRHDDCEPRSVLSEFDLLFVECKPVDAAHPAASRYCDDGLIRFVVGDYAWAMQEGMMLAYARNGRCIQDHLIPAMRETGRMDLLATTQLPKPCPSPDAQPVRGAEGIFVSKHRRSFHWPHGKGQACEIAIYHLWHDCA